MTDALRIHAEEKARASEARPSGPLSPEGIQTQSHELHVHQIELEMQNEELRHIQQELMESQARYFDLYDQAPVGYCTISEQGLITEANLTASTLLGARRGILVTQPFSRFVLKDDKDHWYLHHKRLLEARTADSFDLRMAKKDGAMFWAHLDAATINGEGGGSSCRLAFSDISEGKRAELELESIREGLEDRVRERTGELRRMSASLALAEENERHLIARELHDGIGQLLHVIHLKAEFFSRFLVDEESRRTKEALDGLLLQASRMVRAITARLSPPVLDTLGLVPALSGMAEELRQEFGLLIRLDCAELPRPLPREHSLILFRSLRELLVNVARHSGVLEARLELAVGEGWLLLSVRDKGRGMVDPDSMTPTKEGFGLRSVREHLIQLGGEMSIDSVPGTGSTVTLRLPLPGDASLPEVEP